MIALEKRIVVGWPAQIEVLVCQHRFFRGVYAH